MKRFALLLILVPGCGTPDTGPVAIAYGEDACDLCRMIISEAGFAAEARFGPGKVEKYDDVGCLGERLWEAPAPQAMWVADHGSGTLKPIASVQFIHAPDLKTPMASGVAAFADTGGADAFIAKHGGRRIGLDDIKAMRRPTRTP